MIGAALALFASGLAIFLLPGATVLFAAGIAVRPTATLAYAFAVSLVLLTGAFAICLGLHASIAAGLPVLVALTAASVAAGNRLASRSVSGAETPSIRRLARALHAAGRAPGSLAPVSRSGLEAPRVSSVILLLLAAGAVVSAVAFAPVGSVDRWWYLAYVRGYADAVSLSLAEPFLGTGEAFARFGVHPWLFGLALWSRVSGIDPVTVYEQAAPVLVVLASISAAYALAHELFEDSTRTRLCVVATVLLWSGSMIPVLARAGEDKVLAASALLPLCIASFLRALRAGGSREGYVLLAATAAATAAVHALDYAFALVALLPAAAILLLRDAAPRRAAALACAVLLVAAIPPAISGLVVRERLASIGAELTSADHPVVRVHEGRDRLVALASGGYVVSPRLLLHPLSLVALAGVVLLLRRRAESGQPAQAVAMLPELTSTLLLTMTCVALALAFVPPLPSLAGRVIPPWMVYRVLWLLPLAALSAIAVDAWTRHMPRGENVAMLLLVLVGAAPIAATTQVRLSQARERVAIPRGAEFRVFVHAVSELREDAVVVAAPELAERLPALTARHVLAALDRSTIVFSGSRERGEARLRARAALLAGDADAARLTEAAGVRATHAVYDPRAPAVPRCGKLLHRSEAYALCELASDEKPPAPPPLQLQEVEAAGSRSLVDAECGAAAIAQRRNPWSAAPALSTCRLAVPPELRMRNDLVLVIDAATGRAVDELRIFVSPAGRAGAGYAAAVRTSGRQPIALRMPSADDAAIDVRIESAFLPAVRPLRVSLASLARAENENAGPGR